jgi:two-component system, NtrC family, sensor kinase
VPLRREEIRAQQACSDPRRVLAIDDSDTFLQELADTLRRDGYEVVLAQSGEEELQLLKV